MSYNPNHPKNGDPLDGDELRRNLNAPLNVTHPDPVVQAIIDKVNEFIAAARR